MKTVMILCISVLTLFSCQKDTYVPRDIVLPSNLEVSLTVNSGTVDVAAHADSANFYIFTFYENGDSTMVESKTGSASHTFVASGQYSVKTVAYTAPDYFI